MCQRNHGPHYIHSHFLQPLQLDIPYRITSRRHRRPARCSLHLVDRPILSRRRLLTLGPVGIGSRVAGLGGETELVVRPPPQGT